MWELIGKTYTWEMWKTPTKYLVCWKYIGEFHFFESPTAAKRFFIDKMKEL